MAELVCDGNGQIAVTALMDGINAAVEKAGDTMTGNLEVPSLTIGGVPILPSESSAETNNIIINAEVSRINQRSFDGTSWIAGSYGYDRWKGSSNSGNMIQVIESVFYDKSVNYTLSYQISGVDQTPVIIESPASGDWSIEVPVAARKILLTKGDDAGIYTLKDYSVDMFNCKRYYNRTSSVALQFSGKTTRNYSYFSAYSFPVPMRITPTVALQLDNSSPGDFESPTMYKITEDSVQVYADASSNMDTNIYWIQATLDAEI